VNHWSRPSVAPPPPPPPPPPPLFPGNRRTVDSGLLFIDDRQSADPKMSPRSPETVSLARRSFFCCPRWICAINLMAGHEIAGCSRVPPPFGAFGKVWLLFRTIYPQAKTPHFPLEWVRQVPTGRSCDAPAPFFCLVVFRRWEFPIFLRLCRL